MAQLKFPTLPPAKLGIVTNKSGSYYYVQTYTHHYDKEKKRSVRDSQKTISSVTVGQKYGVIKVTVKYSSLFWFFRKSVAT